LTQIRLDALNILPYNKNSLVNDVASHYLHNNNSSNISTGANVDFVRRVRRARSTLQEQYDSIVKNQTVAEGVVNEAKEIESKASVALKEATDERDRTKKEFAKELRNNETAVAAYDSAVDAERNAREAAANATNAYNASFKAWEPFDVKRNA
ncbi:hypothetical protein PFISCL1PPCAC_25436, partial [Pristionchus fissidentatus]